MKFLKLLCILFISTNSFSQAAMHVANAVNIAGKQRMLGQRMAKDKLFIKANVKSDKATKELEKTIIDFQKGLRALKSFAPTPNIKYKLEIQEYVFKDYKKAILDKSKESFQKIVNSNTLFLNICDDVVTAIIEHAKTLPVNTANKAGNYVAGKVAEATGASGKLRYLTQRLTLYFAMNEFGYKEVSSEELDEIVKTLDKNLNYLTVLEFNTLEIDDALGQVTYYWSQLKDKLYKDGKVNLKTATINADEMYDIANNVLSKANYATKLYADLNKQ